MQSSFWGYFHLLLGGDLQTRLIKAIYMHHRGLFMYKVCFLYYNASYQECYLSMIYSALVDDGQHMKCVSY